MPRGLKFIAALMAAILPAVSYAQPPAEPAPVVEELVVRAYGGVPWWRVSDRDTTVWILALPPVRIPAGVQVDTSSIERRLKGANVLITPLAGGAGLPLLSRSRLDRLMRELNANTRTSLEPSLPPDLRDRFVRAREKLGQPETRYGALPPGLAGMALAGDATLAFDKANPKTDNDQIEALLRQVARRNRVRVTPAHTFNAFPAFLTESRRAGLACLASTLDYIDWELVTPSAAKRQQEEQIFRAWLEGDIRPALEVVRAFPSVLPPGKTIAQARIERANGTLNVNVITGPCLKDIPSHQKIIDTFIPVQTNAIRKALRRKGHAVAVLDPYSLLMQDGVLDRLRREGYTVRTPAAPE
jgi:hypothetical protein